MKRLFTLLLVTLITLSISSLVSAETRPQRIAVLDLQAALLETDKIRQAFEAIDEELSQNLGPLRQLEEEGRALEQQLQRDAEIMAPEERRRLQQRYQEKLMQYQAMNQQLQQVQQQRRQEVINRNRPALESVVNRLLEEHNIDLLIDRQAVHFARPQFDLTPLVIEALGEED